MKFFTKLKERFNNLNDKKFMGIASGGALVLGLFIGVSFSPSCILDHEEVIAGYETQLGEKNKEIKTKDKNIEALNVKIKEADPWFKMKSEEKEALAEENKRKEEEAKAAEEAKLAEEKKKQEEEKRRGYDTGVTYGQLARTPDDYIGKKVKFEGKVIQVMQGDGNVQIRLAVGGNYDNVIYGEYDESIVSSRILEDDYITIMGLSGGLLTYDSTMGGKITIPSVLIQDIAQ